MSCAEPAAPIQWVDDFKEVSDQILKFAPTVPEEKTEAYYEMFQERLKGKVEPTTSGHGSIDLIVPGCHKASGLKRLAERWAFLPSNALPLEMVAMISKCCAIALTVMR